MKINTPVLMIFLMSIIVLRPLTYGENASPARLLTTEDFKRSGFKSREKDGKVLDPEVNGLERRFDNKAEFLKYLKGVQLDYDKIPFDEKSDLLTKRKCFEHRGFWWHVREIPSGKGGVRRDQKIEYSIFALPINGK